MEPRKPKKSRSHGEATKSSRDVRSSLSPVAIASRPQLKDRGKSAPLVPQTSKPKQEKHSKHASTSSRASARPKQDVDTPPLTPTSPLSPVQYQQEELLQNGSASTQHEDSDGLREITLAVVGEHQAGKTTFVQCALDLQRPMSAPSATKKVSLEGVISVLRLIEVPLGDLRISAEQDLTWPETVGGQTTPPVDGALVLYDVMNQDSLTRIPTVLSGLSKVSLPTVLVSSKCDKPTNTWEVDHEMVEELIEKFRRVESFQTSATAPETHKRCISVILRNISSKRSRKESPSVTRTMRPRALTSAHPSKERTAQVTGSESKHTRATSELPSLVTRNSNLHSQGSHSPGMQAANPMNEQQSRQRVSTLHSPTAISVTKASPTTKSPSHYTDDSVGPRVLSGTIAASRPPQTSQDPATRPTPVSIANSFFKIDEDTAEPLAEVGTKHLATAGGPTKDSGFTFDDLVDRLLSQPMSKADGKFAAIFLCLYRKFAAPSELLSAIIQRFQNLNESTHPQISRITSQLRYLSILSQWVSDYPGDFAHAQTRRLMSNFVVNLAGNRPYAVAGKEIGAQLEIVSEDDDTEWACSDKSRSRANTVESFLSSSSVQSTASTLNADSSTEDVAGGATEEGSKKLASHHSASASLSSSTSRSESQSTGSFQTLLNSVENAQRQAQLLTPFPRNALTKIQWHQLADIPDEDIARELTRIDWIMFSSIRPRDLIRHVSLPSHEKDKCKSLENVNRMIDQFNHVAFWVANFIVLRDKPKHRARMLEKFMGIAWKLRQLNNYNSLGAVIAGINGTAVHRLTQTRELVPQQSQKQFMRLEILMGTQKSHFAYRLAWTNTSTERIPFLPLHRRDLVLAEEGNRTYFDDGNTRINWKKFELMGEVVVGIQRSQGTPYPTIARNEEVQRLVLDGRFPKDDDELYERSIHIEGPGVGETRRRFNWYKR